MSIAHAAYIPICVLLGLAIGWMLGGRSAQGEVTKLSAELERLETEAAKRRLDGGDAR
jgi:hypothetical protein